MHEALLLGSLLGALVGAAHAPRVFQNRLNDGEASIASALYYAAWAFVLWTVFGAYILLFWLIGGVWMLLSRRRVEVGAAR